MDIVKVTLKEVKKYGENFIKKVDDLFSKGRAYEQVCWERDIAISQLNELGIAFGENVEEYKEVIDKYRCSKRDNVMYMTCTSKHKLDAVYVCPECYQPVKKESNSCENCGKLLSWFDTPKPAPLLNRFK